MILVLSGEGPSDIGACSNKTERCEGEDFDPGPMAWIIDKLVEPIWHGNSPIGSFSFIFVSEDNLGRYFKKIRKPIVLPGFKNRKQTRFFFVNAFALAKMAKEIGSEKNDQAGAVLFRDSDGTNGRESKLWREKVKSMEDGFAAAEFELGVPMVPKPKSEVWLLCALQGTPYQNCERFEDFSGNDASPNSAKIALKKALEAKYPKIPELSDLLKDGTINPLSIQMPSFTQFRTSLEAVARRLAGQPS